MKSIFPVLTLAFLLLSPRAKGAAAVPYQQLDPHQFRTNSFPFVTLHLNSSQFNTVGDTINITNVSGITGGTIWTNENGTYRPLQLQTGLNATNINSYFGLTSWNAFSTIYSSTLLSLGANCVTAGTHSYIRLASLSTTASDTTVSLTSGNAGQWLQLQKYGTNGNTFTLVDDSGVCDAGGGFLRLRGNWTPTDVGETITLLSDGSDWVETSRANPSIPGGDNLWMNDGVTLQNVPGTDTTLVYSNSVTASRMRVINNTGNEMSIGLNGAGIPSINGNQAQIVYNGKETLIGDFEAILPGSLVDVYGYNDFNFTDYQRLRLSSTGTNGYILYDSQSGGIAGKPRPHHFDTGGQTITTGNLAEFANGGAPWINIGVTAAGIVPSLDFFPTGAGKGALHSTNGFNFNIDDGVNTYQWTLQGLGLSPQHAGAVFGSSTFPLNGVYANNLIWGLNGVGNSSVVDTAGNGSPEGVLAASVGSVYRNTNGTPGSVLYVKETGTYPVNTGWAALGGGGGGGDTLWATNAGGALFPDSTVFGDIHFAVEGGTNIVTLDNGSTGLPLLVGKMGGVTQVSLVQTADNNPIFGIGNKSVGASGAFWDLSFPGIFAYQSVDDGGSDNLRMGLGALNNSTDFYGGEIVASCNYSASNPTAMLDMYASTGSFSHTARLYVADVDSGLYFNSSKVVGVRKTGWTTPTGTAQRSGYATYDAPTLAILMTLVQQQAVADGLQAVSRELMALITDLTTHGLIGP